MTREEAERLLALSREARWAFPSSSGRPVGAVPGASVERLLEERGALVDAGRFLLAARDVGPATELAANTWRVWVLAGEEARGRAFLAAVLDGGVAAPSRARALALYGDGLLAFRQGAYEESHSRSEAALAAARAVEDREALALAHLGLSRSAFVAGDYGRARELASEARMHADGLDPALGQAPLHMQGQSARLAGDHEAAAALLAESLDLSRRLGDRPMEAVELHNLGHVELHRGNIDAAERLFTEAARLDPAGDRYGEAMTQLDEAAVRFGRGDRDSARRLLARAEAIVEESGIELAPDDRFELDGLRARL
jgi:tetratricopeptide (TPR) repeat protein